MSTERFRQRANDLRRAVARLVETCEQPFNPFVRDSAIQRFEFCWELAWKALKLRLEVVGLRAGDLPATGRGRGAMASRNCLSFRVVRAGVPLPISVSAPARSLP
jgi:hypothetical protein